MCAEGICNLCRGPAEKGKKFCIVCAKFVKESENPVPNSKYPGNM